MTMTIALIMSFGDFDEFGVELVAAFVIGLDTEFMCERIYCAELCLL